MSRGTRVAPIVFELVLVYEKAMTTQSDNFALVEWIYNVFKNGIVLNDDLTHFLEATFGSPDIAALMAEDPNSEMDSFLELLCYPDFNTQLRYETLWGDRIYSSQALATIITNLSQSLIKSAVRTPSGNQLCTIDIPGFALESFVRRLNITWRLPAPISRLLDDLGNPTASLKARVHLRNTRLKWHKAQISLVSRFFKKMPPDSQIFETTLIFLLPLLSELSPEQDGYEFLVGKKFFYFQSLCRAETFERKRLSSNMEIMMLQGARAAHGSLEQWRDQMRQIDLICQHLFGQTQFFQQPGEHYLDTEGKDNAQKIQDMISLLS